MQQMVEHTKNKLKRSSKDLFDRWRDSTELKKGDQFPERVKKILFRVLGIILIIIFSPLILLILLFALLAAI
jgi:hypothetical protein